jgi:hypothetical protein
MTDLMLDQLLDAAREPEPMDNGFVASVMDEIHSHEQRRWRMKLVRRPVVFGVAAAVLATSGAVAALVGTHVSPKSVQAEHGTASVTVSLPSASAAGATSSAGPSATSSTSPTGTPLATAPAGLHWGYPSSHTAFALDDTTGLKLTTETYTNDFSTSKAQKVTLTLVNTSANPITISGANGCPLQVTASQDGKASTPVCATSTVSPDNLVLTPGSSVSMDAEVSLPDAGEWNVVGTCRCTYTVTSTPSAPSADTSSVAVPTGLPNLSQSSGLNVGVQPPVSLPGSSASPAPSVTRLSTPPISVRASG